VTSRSQNYYETQLGSQIKIACAGVRTLVFASGYVAITEYVFDPAVVRESFKTSARENAPDSVKSWGIFVRLSP
jgi:hypothetical protein